MQGLSTQAKGDPSAPRERKCVPDYDSVVQRFNATDTAYPQNRTVHELFEEQVERTPEQVALVCAGCSLTYSELNSRANRLGWYLKGKGIGSEQLVAICLERGLEMVVGLLGILKAGAAYVPLDPGYPDERLGYMVQDAAAKVLLTQQHLKSSLSSVSAEIIALDGDWDEIASSATHNPERPGAEINSKQLAYVIYTSGSTGLPKGAMNEHSGVVNRLRWMQDRYRLDQADRVLQKTPFSFDVSVWEFFWTLMTGARLIIARPEGHKDPLYLRELIEIAGVTTVHFVPSMLQSFLSQVRPGDCQTLRHIVCSGEELPASLLKRCLEAFPDVQLSNLYGPTEAAVDVTAWECSELDRAPRVPIGRPIANIQMYVLGECLQPVAVGEVGDLYIGGVGVGRGYLNRPELTAERFLPDPFRQAGGYRLYKTGDLGRWRPDGALEYLGRSDHQVKIRGFRIELGEIEAQLAQFPGVEEAVVVARDDAGGEKRLVAYLRGNFERVDPLRGELKRQFVPMIRTYLKSKLPPHMVPSAVMVVERFPLTPNGKLDRRALPAPEFGAYAHGSYEAPEGELETILADLWQELLGVEMVGRNDNFFEIGGHSLLIVRMMQRLNRMGLTSEALSVIETPTLRALAQTLSRKPVGVERTKESAIPAACDVITPQMLPLVKLTQEQITGIADSVPEGAANVQDIYPLTSLQEGMLFHYLLKPHNEDTYILLLLYSFSSQDDVNAFARGLQAVIDRHDVLRTSVRWEGLRRPVQVVYRRAGLPIIELTRKPDRTGLDQMKEQMKPELQILDLQSAPLMRLQLLHDEAARQWYGLLQVHHLILDYFSYNAMLDEVMAHVEARPQDLPKPVAFREHVARVLELSRVHEDEAFFDAKLGDVAEPTAPFGLLDVQGNGSRVEEYRHSLEPSVAAKVHALARRLGVSVATLFHAAWAMVISRLSDRDDVVFGTVLLGQLHGGSQSDYTLGLFINTLPIRLKLSNRTALDLIMQTRRELADLLAHEHAPLTTAQRCSQLSGTSPLFTTLLNYLHGPPIEDAARSHRTAGIRPIVYQGWSNYPIAMSVADHDGAFDMTAQTDKRVSPQRVMGYLCVAVKSLVEALCEDRDISVQALEILPESERNLLLQEFNATDANHCSEKLVHLVVEEQVRRAPDTIAVQQGSESLTYERLNGQANQLARYLRDRGVGPEQVVAVCLERSLDLIVAMLGILKAGAAYLPIDPGYPPERIRYLMLHSDPRALLRRQQLKADFGHSATNVITVDDELMRSGLRRMRDQNLNLVGLGTHQLAYVIYTSGSTGEPKGVMIEHRNLHNLIAWHIRAFNLTDRTRSSCMAGLGFDASTWEVWPPLCSGGTLVLPGAAASADSAAQLNWWRGQELDVSFLVTPLAEFAYASGKINRHVRDLLIGGDRLRHKPDSLPDGQRLVNNYGPTETAVVATSGELSRDDETLHIGRPIDNTRIYIVDKALRPTPIEVAGEVVIGGASVGRGYLGRSALTAERFIADPFRADLPVRAYRTGDVARWRADGSIEYVGRNDAQVKIRGFRIEPGEIEAQLSNHWQVKEAVVAVREDVPGEKRLVAYVVRRGDMGAGDLVTAETLRTHLKARLPAHMVPGAFVLLDSFPLGPNGKIDRRALPPPEAEVQASAGFESPQGTLEEALAAIWRDVLRTDLVGRRDNFFELGGHSLRVLEAIFRMNASLEGEWRVADIYSYPTIKDLAAYSEGRLGEDRPVDLRTESSLDDSIVAVSGRPRVPPKVVFVTGATGFVGRFLVAQLLRETDSRVYCLVRAQSATEASWRLRSTLQRWDLWRDEFAERTVAIAGDLRKARLGIAAQTYEPLCSAVDSIFHCGASMNHLESYGSAKPANVESVREILRFATHTKPKLVNHISSLGVFCGTPDAPARNIREEDPIDHELHRRSEGYVASKWVGEKILMIARERGIPCNIFRLGLVWADTEQGRYDELQQEYRVFKSCLLSGYGIREYKFQLPPTPVDYVGRAIVSLAGRYGDGGGTFHISAPQTAAENIFECCNEALGTALELRPLYQWIAEIKKLHLTGRSLPAVPLLEQAFTLDELSFQEYERTLGFGTTRFDCTRTWQELERAGIVAPAVDVHLLNRFLENMLWGDAELESVAQRMRGRRRGRERIG